MQTASFALALQQVPYLDVDEVALGALDQMVGLAVGRLHLDRGQGCGSAATDGSAYCSAAAGPGCRIGFPHCLTRMQSTKCCAAESKIRRPGNAQPHRVRGHAGQEALQPGHV